MHPSPTASLLLFAVDPIQLPKSHRAAPPPRLGLNLTWTRCCPGTNLNPRPHQTAHTWSCFSSTTWAPRAPHCAAATTLTSFCLLLSSLKQKGEKKKEEKKQTKEPQARDALRLPTHICLYHLLFSPGVPPCPAALKAHIYPSTTSPVLCKHDSKLLSEATWGSHHAPFTTAGILGRENRAGNYLQSCCSHCPNSTIRLRALTHTTQPDCRPGISYCHFPLCIFPYRQHTMMAPCNSSQCSSLPYLLQGGMQRCSDCRQGWF